MLTYIKLNNMNVLVSTAYEEYDGLSASPDAIMIGFDGNGRPQERAPI